MSTYCIANGGARFFFKLNYRLKKSPLNKARYTQFVKQTTVVSFLLSAKNRAVHEGKLPIKHKTV